MGESQFEKLLKTLSEKKEENERLRGLLREIFLWYEIFDCIDDKLIELIEKEIGDE